MKKIQFRHDKFEGKNTIELQKPTCRDISEFASMIIDKNVAILKEVLDENKELPIDQRVALMYNLKSKKMTSGYDVVRESMFNQEYAEEFILKMAKKSGTDITPLELEPQDFTNIAIPLIDGDYVVKPEAKEADEKK